MVRLAGLAIVLALGVASGCGTNFVASLNSGHGLRVVVCSGGDQFCQDVLSPPSADAGESRTVAAGSVVVLDASGSDDPDGNITSFEWRQLDGPLVTLSDPNSATTSFEAPEVVQSTMLRFELTVTDEDDESDADRVEVVVQPEANVAIVRGLEWLHASVSPATDGLPADVAFPDPETHSTLGAWLVATTTGRYLDRDPTDVESHLANLRGLMTSLETAATHQRQVDTIRATCEASGTETLVAGLTQTARLLDGLDPALAERYRARAGDLAVEPDWSGMNGVYRGELMKICSGDSTTVDPVMGAISMLLALESTDRVETKRVAEATLTVLGASRHDVLQGLPSPMSTQIPLSQRSTASPLLTVAPSS